jgi:hypothetical protein
LKREELYITHLVGPAEDVRVVLLEAPDAREAVQGPRELVAVQHAKVGEAEGELAVGAGAVFHKDTVQVRVSKKGGFS